VCNLFLLENNAFKKCYLKVIIKNLQNQSPCYYKHGTHTFNTPHSCHPFEQPGSSRQQLQRCLLSEHPFTGSPTRYCYMGQPHLYTFVDASVQAQEITCICMHARYWYIDTNKLITSTPTPHLPSPHQMTLYYCISTITMFLCAVTQSKQIITKHLNVNLCVYFHHVR
jgi:hypothetical protein